MLTPTTLYPKPLFLLSGSFKCCLQGDPTLATTPFECSHGRDPRPHVSLLRGGRAGGSGVRALRGTSTKGVNKDLAKVSQESRVSSEADTGMSKDTMSKNSLVGGHVGRSCPTAGFGAGEGVRVGFESVGCGPYGQSNTI